MYILTKIFYSRILRYQVMFRKMFMVCLTVTTHTHLNLKAFFDIYEFFFDLFSFTTELLMILKETVFVIIIRNRVIMNT